MSLTTKRVYEKPSRADGVRILVDRLWPRGISKERAKIDFWLKEVGPSTALRKWFNHDPKKWADFRRKYFAELVTRESDVEFIREQSRKRTLTLLFGAKDERFNNAVALREFLERKRKRS